MRSTVVLLLFVLPCIFSCAGGPKNQLSKEAMEVNILPGPKPPSHCNALGKVVGTNDEGIEELAKNHARNQVADLNGSSLFIKETVTNGNKITIHGVAYKCD